MTRASATDITGVLKALAIAFCTKAAIYQAGNDEYRTVHEDVSALLAPLSALVNGNFEWVVYNSLIMEEGGRVYLETATPIKAEWLVVRMSMIPARAGHHG